MLLKTVDKILYDRKSLREWRKIIIEQQPCEDCVSRKRGTMKQLITYEPMKSTTKGYTITVKTTYISDNAKEIKQLEEYLRRIVKGGIMSECEEVST